MHTDYRDKLTPRDLGACWNVIGRLVRQDRAEQRWVKSWPAALRPLLQHTLASLTSFDARSVAMTVHGLASIERATSWRAGPPAWRDLGAHGVHVVETLDAQSVTNIAWSYATTRHVAPELFTFEPARLRVIVDGDRLGRVERIDGAPNAEVCTGVDVAAVKRLILGGLFGWSAVEAAKIEA